MSVHKEITKHVNKQNMRINQFLLLDEQREFFIEQALQNCREGKAFSVDRINEVTEKINEMSRQGIIPSRKIVTPEMIEEYAKKTKY